MSNKNEEVTKVKKNDKEKSIKFWEKINEPIYVGASFICIVAYIVFFLLYFNSKNYDVSKCDICKLDVCKCDVSKCDVSKLDVYEIESNKSDVTISYVITIYSFFITFAFEFVEWYKFGAKQKEGSVFYLTIRNRLFPFVLAPLLFTVFMLFYFFAKGIFYWLINHRVTPDVISVSVLFLYILSCFIRSMLSSRKNNKRLKKYNEYLEDQTKYNINIKCYNCKITVYDHKEK